MNTLTFKQKVVGVLLALAALWGGSTGVANLGSVTADGTYQATTTVGMASVHNLISANRVVTLGSIVVASSSATAFKVWNATSTTDSASTTAFQLKAAVAEGTYTFDIELPRGLIVERPTGFNGDYVVTYRPQ